jgi:hypothetical protein
VDIFSFRERQRIETFNIHLSSKTVKASPNSISYENTTLAKHGVDERPLKHWNQVNNHPRDESRSQCRVLYKQRRSEKESLFTAFDTRTSKRTKGAKAIHQERKRDSSSSSVIRTFLGSWTTDSTVVLKTSHRQTKAFFTVWQTLSFHSMEPFAKIYTERLIPWMSACWAAKIV